ncbi:hypothetical protein [Bordetella trematum]|uniref:hypothetical protein n=1 Tax=Bordetella trematum TaxID=123899 RepID=UPI0012FFD9AC|nr:hypothetical protein [Bordetella trematum]
MWPNTWTNDNIQQPHETHRSPMKIQTHWHNLGSELKQRSLAPWKHPSFVIYFLIAVAGIGAAGVWLEIYRMFEQHFDLANLRIAVYTFFPVLTATTGLQLIWAEGGMRSMRAFSILIITICLLGWIICTAIKNHETSLWWGIFFSILALWLWVITNAKQPDFLDAINDAPIGGKLDRPLKGDLTGFED